MKSQERLTATCHDWQGSNMDPKKQIAHKTLFARFARSSVLVLIVILPVLLRNFWSCRAQSKSHVRKKKKNAAELRIKSIGACFRFLAKRNPSLILSFSGGIVVGFSFPPFNDGCGVTEERVK